jgi:hypothetical protein
MFPPSQGHPNPHRVACDSKEPRVIKPPEARSLTTLGTALIDIAHLCVRLLPSRDLRNDSTSERDILQVNTCHSSALTSYSKAENTTKMTGQKKALRPLRYCCDIRCDAIHEHIQLRLCSQLSSESLSSCISKTLKLKLHEIIIYLLLCTRIQLVL